MAFYAATVTTDASGDGTNLDANGNPQWNGQFRGRLMGLRFVPDASPEVGTDTTVAETQGLLRTIHTFTDTTTDTTVHPAAAITGATDAYLPYYVESANLKVTVAQGGNAKTVTIIALIE